MNIRTENVVPNGQVDPHCPAEQANDVFFLYNDVRHRLYVSPSCHRVLGYEADELASLTRYAFVHPDDVEVVRSRYAQLSPECPEVSSIHRFGRKDGRYIWVEGLVRLIPPTTQTGELLIANVRDITERRRAEDALRESEQRFRGAFETSTHGFALVSPDGHWLRVNAAFCRIVGYTERELLTRDFQSITHPDDLAADLAYARAMLAGEIDSFQTEKRYLHKTGRVIDIVLSVSLVHDSDGQPLHFVAQILDITGLKRQQVKLEEALTRAEAANVAKQDFLATMSHELRTPLNAIIGFSRMIGDQMFGPLENTEYVDFANEINRSGQHLLGLIEAVLEFSNADAIELKLVRVPVEIGTVARSALEVVADRGHMGGIEFEWAIPSELPLALGDPARIRQILINLLTNAIKFTDRGGTVRLSATRPGDATIAITISDTGKGIAPEHLAHVFEPFYLADGTMNRKIQDGIGLGLPLARRLAELSGGSLTLESELGVGTTATVVLPSLEQ